MTILITGGMGFIGSHCCVALMEVGHRVVVVDNLENSRAETRQRIETVAGREVAFEHGDIRDRMWLSRILRDYACTAVVHLAGRKSVAESFSSPLSYYSTNVGGTAAVVGAMRDVGLRHLIFSSSATVYGVPHGLPLSEEHSLEPSSPYGRTKLIAENMLRDLAASDPDWRIGILRYFNPVGAHSSGFLGEDPLGKPNNLMPFIAQVARGIEKHLIVFGSDYETPDGTGIRDYIHVTDLAAGHLRGLEVLSDLGPGQNCFTLNLGSGRGYSVLEVVRAFERASNRSIPMVFAPRREGDVAYTCADPRKAHEFLGWRAENDLFAMCRDAWGWVNATSSGE